MSTRRRIPVVRSGRTGLSVGLAMAFTLTLGAAGASGGTPATALPGASAVAAPAADSPVPPPAGSAAEASELVGERGQVVALAGPAGTRSGESEDSVWWTWTAAENGDVEFATHGSEVDTVLTVHEGSLGDLTLLATNDDDGDVATSSVVIAAQQGRTYYVEVANVSDDAGWVTLGWHATKSAEGVDAPSAGGLDMPFAKSSLAPSAEGLDAPLSAAAAVVLPVFPDIPLSATTGEKPQSKLWKHDGVWWAVLPSTATVPVGTFVWRMDPSGSGWTAVLQISSATGVQADVKQVGDVTHVLLHGPSSELISLQYDSVAGTYGLWSSRATPTAVSMVGSETATIDVDSTGRMWLAYDTATNVEVRYSDSPYVVFSDPIVLTGSILDDDLAVVTALPGGSVGVLWSDQAARRFAFRKHLDTDPSGTWSSVEVAAADPVVTRGSGIADDHVNVAVHSDGTLYAAVKTGFDAAGMAVIGLLVRHPNGTWDPMITVDGQGTRPIVLLNEAAGIVTVLYTAANGYQNLLGKAAPLGALDFSGPATMIAEGSYDNLTSTKENWSGEVLVMASSATQTVHRMLGVSLAPPLPVAVNSGFATGVGQSVVGVLQGRPGVAGQPVQFQVVNTPTRGSLTINDPATGAFTYTPTGLTQGSDTFTFHVVDGVVVSAPATVSVAILPASGEVGTWLLNDATGLTATDTSGMANDGALTGGPIFVGGVEGTALQFDGVDDRVLVPDDATLDLGAALTVAAWVRPGRAATQYLVKKAAQGTVDGYELGLSANGTPFLRFNQQSSGDAFRVNGSAPPPADGLTWTHLAGTYDGTTMRLYVNGVAVGSVAGPAAIAVNDLPLSIGAEGDGTRAFQGTVDDVRLYGRALSPEQVALLAAPVAADGVLTVGVGQVGQGTLAVSSSAGGPLTFQVVAAPSKGTVQITDPATGAYTYTPTQAGTDTFTFRVQEAGLWSAPATITVTITAAPVAPVAADGVLTVGVGQVGQGTLAVSSSAGGPLTFQVVAAPSKGTVQITDTATGAYTYTPTQAGTDTFTFRVQEAGLWSAPATVTVTITPLEVTPAAVTFTDAPGTAADTYTIPSSAGVRYLLGGSVSPAGTYPASGTVTVIAQATAGYVITAGATTQWSHLFSAASLDPIESYIIRVYNDLFNRDPDPTGLRNWTAALQQGTPYGEVANGITGSDEFRSGLIRESYRHYLGREAEPAGLASWLGEMSRGMHIEQMQAGFLSSPEFYLRSGSDDRQWIADLYRTVLGRSPGVTEVDFWQQRIINGASYRDVALGFLYSTEHLTAVVDAYYVDLLGRHIDPSGQITWVGLIQRGARDEEIIASIVSSAEYRQKA